LVYTKPNAEVYASGEYASNSDKPLGTTPFEVPVYQEPRAYTLRADEYYEKEVTIGMGTENPVVIELDRRPIITLTVGDGVEIYENDKLVATGSMTEEIREPRTFELRKEGYYTKIIELTSSSDPEISTELIPLPIIEIKSDPAGAEVFVKDTTKSLGTTPLKLTIEKATSFEVKLDRYYTEEFTVEAKSQLAEAKNGTHAVRHHHQRTGRSRRV
jgi:hypothetical protein